MLKGVKIRMPTTLEKDVKETFGSEGWAPVKPIDDLARLVFNRVVRLDVENEKDFRNYIKGIASRMDNITLIDATYQPTAWEFKFGESDAERFLQSIGRFKDYTMRTNLICGGASSALGHDDGIPVTPGILEGFRNDFRVAVNTKMRKIAQFGMDAIEPTEFSSHVTSIMSTVRIITSRFFFALEEFAANFMSILAQEAPHSWSEVPDDAADLMRYIPDLRIYPRGRHWAMSRSMFGFHSVTRIWIAVDEAQHSPLVLVSIPFVSFLSMMNTVYARGDLVERPGIGTFWTQTLLQFSAREFVARLDEWTGECATRMGTVPVIVVTFVKDRRSRAVWTNPHVGSDSAVVEMLEATAMRLSYTGLREVINSMFIDATVLQTASLIAQSTALSRDVLLRIVYLEARAKGVFDAAVENLSECKTSLMHSRGLCRNSYFPLALYFLFDIPGVSDLYIALGALVEFVSAQRLALLGGAWSLGHTLNSETQELYSQILESFPNGLDTLREWSSFLGREPNRSLSDVALRTRAVLIRAEKLLALYESAVRGLMDDIILRLMSTDDYPVQMNVLSRSLYTSGALHPIVQIFTPEVFISRSTLDYNDYRLYDVIAHYVQQSGEPSVAVSIPFSTVSALLYTVYARGSLERNRLGRIHWDLNPQITTALKFVENVDGWIEACEGKSTIDEGRYARVHMQLVRNVGV